MLESGKMLGSKCLEICVLALLGIALKEIDSIFVRFDLVVDILLVEFSALQFGKFVNVLTR